MILGIPISPQLPKDSKIWAWTKNGKFSVRSAYEVAVSLLKIERQSNDGEGSLDCSKMEDLWKSI